MKYRECEQNPVTLFALGISSSNRMHEHAYVAQMSLLNTFIISNAGKHLKDSGTRALSSTVAQAPAARGKTRKQSLAVTSYITHLHLSELVLNL